MAKDLKSAEISFNFCYLLNKVGKNKKQLFV